MANYKFDVFCSLFLPLPFSAITWIILGVSVNYLRMPFMFKQLPSKAVFYQAATANAMTYIAQPGNLFHLRGCKVAQCLLGQEVWPQ